MTSQNELPARYEPIFTAVCKAVIRKSEARDTASSQNEKLGLSESRFFVPWLYDYLSPKDKKIFLAELKESNVSASGLKSEKDNGFPGSKNGKLAGKDRAKKAFEMSARYHETSTQIHLSKYIIKHKDKLESIQDSEDLVRELLSDTNSDTGHSIVGTSLISAYLDGLKQSREWSTIPSVLHDGPDIEINRIYTELYFLSEKDREDKTSKMLDLKLCEKRGHYIHADSLLIRTHARAVIVGPPGSGKTTFMRWLCNYLLREGFCPLPIKLREFSDALFNDCTLSLKKLAVRQILRSEDVVESILSQLSMPNTPIEPIYLLDGWDEIPTSQRQVVRDLVNQETQRHRCFITSRPSGMPGILRDGETEFYEVGPLTDISVAELCKNYGEVRGCLPLVYDFLVLLETTPSLWSISANPYLLSLFCEVVFAHGHLPEYRVCSPYWVMTQAIELMITDHNFNSPGKNLDLFDLGSLKSIAYDLSFNNKEKSTVFDATVLTDGFASSGLAESRFFNSSHHQGVKSLYEFSHLRMQEYFAASGLKKSDILESKNRIKQLILSKQWEEEVCFLAAELSDQPHSYFWSVLNTLLGMTDATGELLRRAASMLSTFGANDGGLRLLKLDLRKLLWNRAKTEALFLDKNIGALLKLDADFLLNQTQRLLPKLQSDNYEQSQLIETIYRTIPFELRRTQLDAQLNKKSHLSWLIGLPARAFPNVENLAELTKISVDPQIDINERLLAIKQLGAARASLSVTDFIYLFRDESAEIATAAIESLSKIGGREAAMAMAHLLVDQKVDDPGCISALLNGLSIDGYGILEPHSYAFLLNAMSDLEYKDPLLELVLSALEGVTLPQPPQMLLDLIDDKNDVPEETAKAAVSLFKGITDASILSSALHKYLNNKIAVKVRLRLIASMPFIPVSFTGCDAFWRYFVGLQINFPKSEEFWSNYDHYTQGEYYEFKHVLRLLVNTLKRFPNHPLRRFYLHYIKECLNDDNLIRSPLSEALILSASIAKNDNEVCEKLIAIASSSTTDDVLRGSAINALKNFDISSAQLRNLTKLLESYFDNPTENSGVAHALITNFPELSFKYGNQIINFEQNDAIDDLQEIKDLLLNRSQSLGYLFLNNQLISPLGEVVD